LILLASGDLMHLEIQTCNGTTSRIETYKMEKWIFLDEPYKPERRE
jgi:hypothetical protein